ncbi:MAG: 30S ribosomal protein S7 [Proteobacteria bacterium]|jgi:small subunit ribosomal protein S7|nr:30S ribosomal protein S7 [Pseudomonadota bacterium]
MPRRREVIKREVLPDPQYHDKLVAKCINSLMLDGKKSVAEGIMYGVLDLIGERLKNSEESSLEIFKKAVDNARPSVEVKSRRVGGSTYQVPVEIRADRRTALAFRWLIGNARKRPEKSMVERFAAELIDAYNNRGTTIKKKEDVHRMAEANKAFAHYRF